jgi:hypothetical protein
MGQGLDWSSKPAMDELIQHVTIGLEENVLRQKLLLKDQLNLEWSWQEEPSKGGSKCTILAHIPSTPISSTYNTKSTYTRKLSNKSQA